MIRIMPSSPDYDEISNLANLLAIAHNAHMYQCDLPDAELAALIDTLEAEMLDAIDSAIVERIFGG